ncbi:MAG: hypothetical protein ABI615_01735 [Chthoniobacterales bacterium]
MISRSPTPVPASSNPPPLRPGNNVRMGHNALGIWIEGPSSGAADFRHPWLVSAGAKAARIGRGLILTDEGAAVEPLIGATPMTGSADGKLPSPSLKIDSSIVNASGESWICVEVTPDIIGHLDPDGKKSKVEIVQRRTPSVMKGLTGRAPLALLVWRKGQTSPTVVQIAMFFFRYKTSLAASGVRSHFFV